MSKRSRKQRAQVRKKALSAPPKPAQPGSTATTPATPATAAAAPTAAAESAYEAPAPDTLESDDHRASPRVSVVVAINLSSDSHFFSGLSGDISEGGLFLSTYRPLPVGSAVDLEFSLPGSEDVVHARGEVRWLREHSPDQPRGVGIAFDELPDGDRERIHHFCTMRPPLYYDDVG